MKDAYTIRPVFTVSMVSGIIFFPASSFMGLMFTAQRIDTIFMKSEVVAMCRPTQILWYKFKLFRRSVIAVAIPRSKSLSKSIHELKAKNLFETYKAQVSCAHLDI